MSSTLLNISGKIDSATIALYQSVSEAAKGLNIAFVVVGASARDIVLHYGYGAKIQRATADVDFGIQVPDWAAFEGLKQNLLENGFKETGSQQRLISMGEVQIDIVPFGQIKDEHSTIAWPPDGDTVMSVLGFQEACDNAEIVRIQDNPAVDIPVATPEGMAILKLIAWTDRTSDVRRKDAKDLLYLFTTYKNIPAINVALHEDQELMASYGWEIDIASAYQLGIDAEFIAEDKTYDVIASLFNGEHDLSVETLIEEMCEQVDREYERNEALMNAFIDGFLKKSSVEE